MFDRAITVLAHCRPDDIPGVVTTLCEMASWAGAAGRYRERNDAVSVAAHLLEERGRRQGHRLLGREDTSPLIGEAVPPGKLQ